VRRKVGGSGWVTTKTSGGLAGFKEIQRRMTNLFGSARGRQYGKDNKGRQFRGKKTTGNNLTGGDSALYARRTGYMFYSGTKTKEEYPVRVPVASNVCAIKLEKKGQSTHKRGGKARWLRGT